MNATEKHVATVEALAGILAIAPESLGPAPLALDEISVGDVVAIYSRGTTRTARVAKIGRTKITTEYVTRGGIDDAIRRHSWMSVDRLLADAADCDARARKQERLAEGVADDEKVQTGAYSTITGKGLRKSAEAYRHSAEVRREEAALPRGDYWKACVTVTRKAVAIEDVVGWKTLADVRADMGAAA